MIHFSRPDLEPHEIIPNKQQHNANLSRFHDLVTALAIKVHALCHIVLVFKRRRMYRTIQTMLAKMASNEQRTVVFIHCSAKCCGT
jgi:hypothetical protein